MRWPGASTWRSRRSPGRSCSQSVRVCASPSEQSATQTTPQAAAVARRELTRFDLEAVIANALQSTGGPAAGELERVVLRLHHACGNRDRDRGRAARRIRGQDVASPDDEVRRGIFQRNLIAREVIRVET